MTKKAYGAAAAALAFATVVSAPAQAATALFDFTSNPTSVTTGTNNCGYTQGMTCGNSMTWTINGVSVKATAWSINTNASPDVTQNAILTKWDQGLGVDNRNQGNGSPEHAIDNENGWVDFVLLQFSQEVDVNTINVGWAYNDSDLTLKWGDVGGAWDKNPGLHNQNINILNNLIDGSADYKVNSAATGTRTVNPNNEEANWWIVSALTPNDNKQDYFKLKAIEISYTPPVPEPATWLMMIAGFGTVGGLMRRQRRIAVRKQGFVMV